MKNLLKPTCRSAMCVVFLLFLFCNNTFAYSGGDTLVAKIFEETKMELEKVESLYEVKINSLYQELHLTKNLIKEIKTTDHHALTQKVDALIKLGEIKDAIIRMEEDYQIDLYRVRYRKGIELIKMIYEKVLGLDHHFTSLQTFQNVNTLSNPNSFPEFTKSKELLQSRMSKKQSVRLPQLLETNPYVSMTFTLVSSLFGGGEKKDREKSLDRVACIMDFTVRMNSDLKTVYYETEFLRANNQTLKEESIELFKDYVKVIGYKTTLQDCRREDDWETVYELLDTYIMEMKKESGANGSPQKVYNQQVNIIFSIDRLMQFMDKYSAFIASGEKYYQKFQTILNNYTNEDICQSQLPRQFSDLKKDIEMSILKFNEAYNISELQGSKLKDLMYGVQN